MKMFMPACMSLGFLLISLGIGYFVFAQASKETKGLKTLGYIIGIVIIAMSTVIIISKAILFCGYSKMCPLKGKMDRGMMMEKGMMEHPGQKK